MPQLVPPAELERIRSEARASPDASASVTVLRLLEHIDIQHRAILQIASRTEDFGSPEERARVAAAQEMVAEDAPVHVRIEFERQTVPDMRGFAVLVAMMRD